ncbi:hypothetical protein EV121DRAFT_295068 [Schizophyllum commune]
MTGVVQVGCTRLVTECISHFQGFIYSQTYTGGPGVGNGWQNDANPPPINAWNFGLTPPLLGLQGNVGWLPNTIHFVHNTENYNGPLVNADGLAFYWHHCIEFTTVPGTALYYYPHQRTGPLMQMKAPYVPDGPEYRLLLSTQTQSYRLFGW